MTANRTRYDRDNVKHAVSGHWIDTLCAALGWQRGLFGAHQPCPRCGGNDRFRSFDDVDETGGVVCAQCGTFADGFATIMHFRGCDFATALALVAEHIGVEPKKSTSRREADPAANLDITEWSSGLCAILVQRRPGLTEEAILAAGGRMAVFKRNYKVVAFPVIGESLDTSKPVGWVLIGATGGTLPKYNRKTKSTEQVKTLLTNGSSSGLERLTK